MGDREQKRVFHTPDGDNNWNFYPWTYNLLGASGNALAVYHGAQISDGAVRCIVRDQSASPVRIFDYSQQLGLPYRRNAYDLDTNRNIVFMYPVEFNAASAVSYRPKRENFYGTKWEKHIILSDRMGSTKMVISPTETEKFDYLPFGKLAPDVGGDDDQRTAYIGKELDRESELGDHGVRKVDYGLGRFTTCDPLWEKYYAWSPYQYSMNNPVSFLDENGGVVIATDSKMQAAVIESVEPQYRQYLSFNGNGVLQVNAPTPILTENVLANTPPSIFNVSSKADIMSLSNFAKLSVLAKTEKETFKFKQSSTYDFMAINSVSNEQFIERGMPLNVSKKIPGIFLANSDFIDSEPSGSLFNTENNCLIILNPDINESLTKKESTPNRGKTAAHELLGHGFLFFIQKYLGSTLPYRQEHSENGKADHDKIYVDVERKGGQ